MTGQRMTPYASCMTMLSFRVEDEDAAAIQRWADELGVDRSALLRDAVRIHLNRLASESDAVRWEELPLTDGESALAAVADWGLAEEWEDWADAPDSTR